MNIGHGLAGSVYARIRHQSRAATGVHNKRNGLAVRSVALRVLFAAGAVTGTLGAVVPAAGASGPGQANIRVSLNPTAITADGSSTSTATIAVTDSLTSLAVPSEQVSLAATPTGTVSFPNGSTCTTNASGICSLAVKAGIKAGTVTITATGVSPDTGTGSGTLTLNPGPVSTVNVGLVPSSVPADGSSSSSATATVKDVNGNLVGGVPVSFGTDGSATFPSGTTCTTASSGAALGTCAVAVKASSTVGTETITATASGHAGSATLTEFTAPAQITAAVNPTNVRADGSSTTTATATVKDGSASHNLVGGTEVTFTTSGDATFPAGNTCITGSTGSGLGVCSVVIRSSSTADKGETVTATDGTGTTGSNTATFTEAGAPSTVTVGLNPDTVVANGTDTSSATATVKDSNSTPVPGELVKFTSSGDVTFSNSGTCTTDSTGSCSATITASKTAGAETITATTTNSKTGTATLTENPGTAASVVLGLSPNSLPADGASQSTATVTVKDANNNPLSSAVVGFTTSGDVTFSNTSCNTNSVGTCSVTITASTTSGNETITAATAANNKTGTATLTETAVQPATVAVTLNPSSIAADGTSTSTATATVKDANNNLVAGTPVSFATGGDVSFPGGSTCTTAANGTCSVTIQASTTADTETITATATKNGTQGTAMLTETGPVALVSLGLVPSSIPADGASTSTATATVKDATGNLVPGATVTFGTNGDATFPSSNSCTTASSGAALGTCSVQIKASTTADTESISANSGGHSASAPLTEFASPADVTLVLNPTVINADGSSTTTATATVKDGSTAHNPVGGTQVTFTTNGDATFPAGSTCITAAATGANPGTCSVVIRASSTPDKGETITAKDGTGTTGSNTATLTEAGAPATVTVVLNPSTVTANGTDTSTATATVVDSNGTLVPGAVVTFSTNGDVTFSDSGTCTTATSGAGLGTCSVTITASPTADTETITVTTANSKTGTAPLTESPGPVTSLTVNLDPASIPADGASTSQATVTVTDAEGNVVPQAAVTFTTSGDVTFSNNGNCTSDATGTCSVTITASTTSGNETITATSNGHTGAATLTETAGPVASVAVGLAPSSIPADGASTSTATATVKDANNNPVSGAVVAFGRSGDVTFPGGSGCTTGAAGTCSVTIQASNTADTETITATSNSKQGSADLTETAGPPTAITLALAPDTVPSDGHSTSTASVTVVDRNSNPVPGSAVSFATDGDVTFSNGGQCTTDSAGSCSVTITASRSDGTENITATDGAANTTAKLHETFAPGRGYWMVAADGGIFTFGDAGFYGSEGGKDLNAPIVGMAATPDGKGYWLVAADGGIFTFGDAGFYGSEGGQPLNEPIVGMAATPSGHGYWLVAADGGIFTFGDAVFHGSEGGQPLNAPILGMAPTSSGHGYWMVAADGGIFTFGDAGFFGSEGGKDLNAPVLGMAATPDGQGYWLVAADGGIFTFGDAGFFGSEGGKDLNAPVLGMAATPDGQGYWLVAADGGIFTFGDAGFYGSEGGKDLNAPILGVAAQA